MKRTVRAWMVLDSRSMEALETVANRYRPLLVYMEKPNVFMEEVAIECTIIYDDGKPAKGGRKK